MASLVRFTVSSELLDGPGGADAAYDEDVPSFPSLMRPSSTVGAASVASAQDEVGLACCLSSPLPESIRP